MYAGDECDVIFTLKVWSGSDGGTLPYGPRLPVGKSEVRGSGENRGFFVRKYVSKAEVTNVT